jgi:hypothetical protein
MRTIQDVLDRLRDEYREMPGLRLKPEQVQRLCGIEQTGCQLVLDSLVDEGFLREVGRRLRTSDGRPSSASREGRVSEPTHVPKDIVSLPERDRLTESSECSG